MIHDEKYCEVFDRILRHLSRGNFSLASMTATRLAANIISDHELTTSRLLLLGAAYVDSEYIRDELWDRARQRYDYDRREHAEILCNLIVLLADSDFADKASDLLDEYREIVDAAHECDMRHVVEALS